MDPLKIVTIVYFTPIKKNLNKRKKIAILPN